MIKVKVPASSANLGPGFDFVGMALELYNTVYFYDSKKEKRPEGSVLLSPVSLAHRAYRFVAKKVKSKTPLPEIALAAGIPRARGLGSSASLSVAGLVAANVLLQANLTEEDMVAYAAQLEGHPDNAAPALLGGIVVCLSAAGKIKYLRFMPQRPLQVVAAAPEFELKTREARKVLPQEVAHGDAVLNTGRFGFFIAALLTGDYTHLSFAMEDLLHQPYRSRLVPGMQEVMAAAITAGALGSCLSGAGPSILALCDKNTADVSLKMREAWEEFGIKAHTYVLNIAERGANYEIS